jgi:biotin operon repressor
MSQNEIVLSHLQDGGTLTQEEAKNLYGIARLASRINDLRDMGYKIDSTRIDVLNRWGETCHVAQYSGGQRERR